MMFLLRAAFWVSIVLIALPTGHSKTRSDAIEIGATDAASAASAAISDLSGFCQRQPHACVTGSQVAVVLGERAQAGAQMIYDFLAERGTSVAKQDGAATHHRVATAGRSGRESADTTGSITVRHARIAPLPRARPPASQDTLTASDRVPLWHAPALRQEARLRSPQN